MVHLLIGPTNAGKTTWLERHPSGHTVFAFQLADGAVPPAQSTLHYNLLHRAPALLAKDPAIRFWNLREDPLLDKLLQEGRISSATVIVAPVRDLLSRAQNRTIVEKAIPASRQYRAARWLSILRQVDLPGLYQQLFDLFDQHAIASRVLLNAGPAGAEMPEIRRADIATALRGAPGGPAG